MTETTVLMDEATVRRTLMRMAHEIVEKNKGTENLVLVGIARRGATLAWLLRDNIARIENVTLPCGALDIRFYRDDLTRASEAPVVRETGLPFDVTDKRVVLVDDVLFTGRTVRAAIEALFAQGRPQCIELASSSTGATGSCPSGRILWGRAFPLRCWKRWRCRCRNTTAPWAWRCTAAWPLPGRKQNEIQGQLF